MNDKTKKQLESVTARKESPLAQFTDKIGKVEILEKEAGQKTTLTHGFYCSTCKASFTSSDAYLDHCNGRVHQKNMGLSLKIERVDEVDRVKAKLEALAKKRLATEERLNESDPLKHLDRAVELQEKDSQDLKEQRKQRKKLKKNNSALETSENNETQEEEQVKDTEEDMMASIMGFKSFT